MSRWLVRLAWAQGAYFVLTGAWALVHLESFLWVTGPKTDLWLVRTISLLIGAVGLALLVAALRQAVTLEVALLAVLSALALGAADVVFATSDVIRDVYLLDALVEAALVALWCGALWRARSEPAVWGAWRMDVPQAKSAGARPRRGGRRRTN